MEESTRLGQNVQSLTIVLSFRTGSLSIVTTSVIAWEGQSPVALAGDDRINVSSSMTISAELVGGSCTNRDKTTDQGRSELVEVIC